jgi:hypothetical protein
VGRASTLQLVLFDVQIVMLEKLPIKVHLPALHAQQVNMLVVVTLHATTAIVASTLLLGTASVQDVLQARLVMQVPPPVPAAQLVRSQDSDGVIVQLVQEANTREQALQTVHGVIGAHTVQMTENLAPVVQLANILTTGGGGATIALVVDTQVQDLDGATGASQESTRRIMAYQHAQIATMGATPAGAGIIVGTITVDVIVVGGPSSPIATGTGNGNAGHVCMATNSKVLGVSCLGLSIAAEAPSHFMVDATIATVPMSLFAGKGFAGGTGQLDGRGMEE